MELFLNDRTLGIRRLQDASDGCLTWEAEYEAGVLRAAAVAKDGQGREEGKAVACELHTASEPAKLEAVADRSELAANGQDVAHIEIQVTDGSGKPVYLADHPVRLTIEGPGEILGLENGDTRDLEPYSSRTRRAHRGMLLAYVRAGIEPGVVTVTARAEGLEPARVAINVK